MKRYLILLFLLGWGAFSGQAQNQVRVLLRLEPATKRFWCRYTLLLPADTAHSRVLLNVNKQFRILSVRGARLQQHTIRPYRYPVFQDTVQGVEVLYAAADHRQKQLEITYEGTLPAKFATNQVMEFSGHTNWLPLIPYNEYKLVKYELEVQVPPAYTVVSTQPATRQRAGRFHFRGTTSAIELTAVVAQQFQQLSSATPVPTVTIYKAGAPLLPVDTVMLAEADKIIAFYNQSVGRLNAIRRFSILLPGTDRDAFGLRDNGVMITYADFDVRKQEDRLILAHEISHKWWAHGSFSNYNDWLNEAFAVYSSLLYVRAAGDTAAYHQELSKRELSATGAPAIIGFDKTKHDYPTYRRVIYDKGTTVLAALHNRLGDEKFLRILAATAARKVATTNAFGNVVAQEADEETRRWLIEKLSH